MTRLSSNAVAKAVASEPDLVKQNQAMETVNVDITDIVEQILTWEVDGVPAVTIVTPKSTQDVQRLFAQANMRLRLIKAVKPTQAVVAPQESK